MYLILIAVNYISPKGALINQKGRCSVVPESCHSESNGERERERDRKSESKGGAASVAMTAKYCMLTLLRGV